MYLGPPRMAEVVVGEKVTLEEMVAARAYCTVSGCGDVLVADDDADSWRRSATSSTCPNPGMTHRRSRYPARSRRDARTSPT